MNARNLLYAASILLLQGPGETSCQTVTKETGKDSLESALDKLVPGLLKETGVPGVSIAVIRNGKVFLSKGYGLADKEKHTAVTNNTRFQIGSVSKTITAIAMMKLAEAGVIDLDSPVNKYTRTWKLRGGGFDSSQVTVRRMLSHTAGLSVRGYHGVYKPGEALPTLRESLNGYEGSDGGLKIIHAPGTVFQYSSGGYTLLQLLVSDVTGKSFEEYISSKIFRPLQIHNSGYAWTKDLQHSVATPYDESGRSWPHYQYVESASGGMYTTASDLARIIAILCDSSTELIDVASRNQILAASEGTGGKYGLGCKLFPINDRQVLVTHDGANEGWRAAYYLHPVSGDGIVLLTNSDNGGKIGAPIICTVFKRTVVDMSALCATLPKKP